MNARRKVARGFTLLEILLVIAIIGMLAGAAIVALVPAREGAKIDTTKIKIQQVMNGLDRYNLNMGHYPTEEEGGLDALLEEPSSMTGDESEKKWRGPYLTKSPSDEWGQPLKYELATDEETNREVAHVSSNGPDKQEGTDDDIKSWSDDEGSGT